MGIFFRAPLSSTPRVQTTPRRRGEDGFTASLSDANAVSRMALFPRLTLPVEVVLVEGGPAVDPLDHVGVQLGVGAVPAGPVRVLEN